MDRPGCNLGFKCVGLNAMGRVEFFRKQLRDALMLGGLSKRRIGLEYTIKDFRGISMIPSKRMSEPKKMQHFTRETSR